MAFKNFSIPDMVGLSSAWLDPQRAGKIIATHKRTRHMVDDIEQVHQGLLSLEGPAELPPEIKAIVAQQIETDGLHDRKARGVNLVLTGLIELADDPELGEDLARCRDVLQPDGLSFITTSYAAEAGVAEQVSARLGQRDEVKATLQKVPLAGKRTLLDEVNAWLDAGKQLGKLETQRVQLQSRFESASATQAQNPKARARNRWLVTVQTLVSNIELDSPVDPALVEAVIAPLRDAEQRADARASRRSKDDSTKKNSPQEPPK